MKKLIKQVITISLGFLLISPCYAEFWQNLWNRQDEQAMKLLEMGKAKQAAKQFDDPEWRSIAHYRAGNYEETVTTLKPLHSARSLYNQGNALAHLGQYEKAIAAYDEALKIETNDKDAKFNRDLLQKLLQQQQQQKQDKSKHSSKNINPDIQKSQSENKPGNNKQQPQNQQTQNKSRQEKQQQPLEQKNAQEKRAENEKDQETKQWLNRIPEDPGGLLREKFLRDYQRRRESSANAN